MLWSRNCHDRALVGTDLIELAQQYKSLREHPAFKHYQGMIWSLKDKIESGILTGVQDGKADVTPQLRAIYGMLLQVIAIPSQIENKTLAAEYQAGLVHMEDNTEQWT